MARMLLNRLAISLAATITLSMAVVQTPAAIAEPSPNPVNTAQADSDAVRIRNNNAPIRDNPNAGRPSTSPAKVTATRPCSEVMKQLATLNAKGVDRVMCSLPPKPRVAAEDPPGGVPPGVPSWCKDENMSWFGQTRFNQCFWQTENVVWVVPSTGKIVGGMDFTHYVDIITVWNEGALTYGEHIWPHSEWGSWSPNTQISFGGTCNPDCTAVSVSGPKPLQLRTWTTFNATFRISVPAQKAEDISLDSVMTWADPEGGDWDTKAQFVTDGPNDLRCDNGKLKGWTNSGCVFSETWPTLTFKKSELPEITGHISRAQSRGVPGAPPAGGEPGSALTRMYDDADAKENHDDACSYLTDPRPPASSCDEYPFAHTYEGAYTGGGDWMSDFSAEWVSEAENSKQGSMYSDFGRSERLLDKDAFYVKADLRS